MASGARVFRLPRRRIVVSVVAILAATSGVVIRLAGQDPRAHPTVVPAPTTSASAPPSSPAFASPPPSSPAPSPGRPERAVTPEAAGTPTSKRPDAGGPVPGARTQEASMDEMLQRDRPPPDGVPEQLEFFVGGGPGCAPNQGPDEMRVAAPEVVTIPSAPLFCLIGFHGEFPVTFEVTTPAGVTLTKNVPPGWDATAEPVFPFPPGSAEGRYTVDVHQGKGHARATFVARKTDHPTMSLHPLRAAAGSTIDVFFGGLPPGKTTDVHLYACVSVLGGTHIYQATHTVTTNAAGEAHLALHTSAATPATCYLLSSLEIIDPRSLPDGGDLTNLQFAVYADPSATTMR